MPGIGDCERMLVSAALLFVSVRNTTPEALVENAFSISSVRNPH
jgi:hypothetical protein